MKGCWLDEEMMDAYLHAATRRDAPLGACHRKYTRVTDELRAIVPAQSSVEVRSTEMKFGKQTKNFEKGIQCGSLRQHPSGHLCKRLGCLDEQVKRTIHCRSQHYSRISSAGIVFLALNTHHEPFKPNPPRPTPHRKSNP